MDTLCNLELDLEYLTSQIVSGVYFPKDYVTIRTGLSKIKTIDVSNEIDLIQAGIQKIIISSFGTLKDKEIEKFYLGKQPELLDLLSALQRETSAWSPKFEEALVAKFEEAMVEMEQNMQGQDSVGMGEAIAIASNAKTELDFYRETHKKLLTNSILIEKIISLYGISSIKVPKKKIKVNLDKQYQQYINELLFEFDQLFDNLELSVVLGRALGTIQSLFPKQPPLDPLITDQANNILDILSSPQDFYTDCETESIATDTVGKTFGFCYPEYYHKYMEIYLEKYDKMDFQDQINFKKSFGVNENYSDLLMLTNAYIKISYTT